jgi:nucleoside-diphosphate-sugar epimerase
LEDVLTRTNVDATRDILSLAERAKVRRVIYTSSAKTIGWDSRRAMQDESVAYNFDLIDNEYGRAKARAEQIVMAFSGAMEIITLNPVAVLGAQDFAPTPTGRFLQKAIREPVHFHLGIQMQFVDAHDVARVHFAAATQGSNRERYILAAPPIPMRNVFNIIDALIGWKRLNIRVPLTLLSPLGYMFEFIARRSRFHPPVTRASAAVGIRKIILDGRRAENTFGIKYRDVRSALHESVIWFMGCCP